MAAHWPVVLRHERLTVRPLRRADAARWRELREDDSGWLGPWEATLPPGAGPVSGSYRSMIASMRARARKGQSMPFAVCWDGQMVGQVTVNGITWGSARWASIGYWVHSGSAGRGITPTAVALVCDHLFGTADLHRVEIAIRPENAASLRVVDKLGFDEVGLAPGYLHIAGQWRDHRVFQLLKEQAAGGVLRRVDRPAG